MLALLLALIVNLQLATCEGVFVSIDGDIDPSTDRVSLPIAGTQKDWPMFWVEGNSYALVFDPPLEPGQYKIESVLVNGNEFDFTNYPDGLYFCQPPTKVYLPIVWR